MLLCDNDKIKMSLKEKGWNLSRVTCPRITHHWSMGPQMAPGPVCELGV